MKITVEKALAIATEKAASINAGIVREATAKEWKKANSSRTYISIKCSTLNGKVKKIYDCGYIDNNSGEYVFVEGKSEVDLSENLAEVTVKIYTFTGMEIQGTYTATFLETANGYEVTLHNGNTIAFDAETMKQINSKNPKFANSIKIV